MRGRTGFVAVYDRYAQRLLTYAYRRTGSAQRAEDAVSLVMLEAWWRRREVRFGADETLAGWLFRTARYVLANEARAARRHRQALAPLLSGRHGLLGDRSHGTHRQFRYVHSYRPAHSIRVCSFHVRQR